MTKGDQHDLWKKAVDHSTKEVAVFDREKVKAELKASRLRHKKRVTSKLP